MSQVKVELVSIDAGKLSKPSDGYSQTASVDLQSLKKVGALGSNGLPISSEKFPLGAPIRGIYAYEGEVYESTGSA